MSEEQFKAFLEKVQSDRSLQEKLNAALSPEAIVVIAKAAGFVISAHEIKTAQSTPQELSDEELDGLNGGLLNGLQLGPGTLAPQGIKLPGNCY